MRKIPTLFLRDPATNLRTLAREVHPDCQWVLDGEGMATRKFDGTCVLIGYPTGSLEAIDGGRYWKRNEVKAGKTAPAGFIEEGFDETTGKRVGWVAVGDGPEDRWHREGLEHRRQTWGEPDPGTYELCGPKVQGNPEQFTVHVLVPHGQEVLTGVPRDYEGLQAWLAESDFEGIVWHHPEGRMAKIKRKDFR